MDLFAQQWGTYRAVVEHDLMEHRAIAAATAAVLEEWLARRSPADPAAQMVDLGCGDLAQLAPLLRRLPLGAYTGLDLTPQVLPLAQRALGPVTYPCQWIEGDLLRWASDGSCDGSRDGDPQVDIIHSAFAIHHLSEQEKQQCLEALRGRIAPGGLFIWVDVFRNPGESREAYLQRYQARIASSWPQLSEQQKEQVSSHLAACDHPADRLAIAELAEATGWRWRWAWSGRHQAEAMAVLTTA
ncbi:MAG: class I SAM-dependent methyltransferase [Vulcanococcus sp.]